MVYLVTDQSYTLAVFGDKKRALAYIAQFEAKYHYSLQLTAQLLR
jgi:hypothetical protein